MAQRIKSSIRYYEGLSSEEKPQEFIIGSRFYEIDTGNTYNFDGTSWVLLSIPKTRVYLWNVESWEWEASTKGSGAGEAVSVENFPAVISGSEVPVSGAFYPTIQPVSGTFYLDIQPVSMTSIPLPSGSATEAKQTILESLTETLQELIARLDIIAGMANAGAPSLRVMVLTGSTTAVTGSLTSAGTVSTVTTVTGITNIGAVPAYTMAIAQQNLTATLANINNVVGV